MVKADVRRDYYADLGLTPSADAEDIKKQFRKLALKYHPDRNPGRELEFNAKFQAIQAAHEILSDPQQRLRYDTERLRAGYGKLYGPPKANTSRKTPANPYASASTAKPQTPKHPSASRPQSFHNGPSTGAQRYASYARAAPKQPWEKTQDEGQTRADAYRGFQEMKGNSSPGWSHFDPRTGRAAYTGTAPRPDATPNGHPTRPKSAYEYFKASPKTGTNESSRTQSARKKQGFAPGTAGGDEPMAANTSSYTSVPRRERFQASDSFQRETAPSPTADRPAPTSGYRAENTATPDFERTSSKYAGTGGERTFFSSSWLRSEGVRTSPKNSRTQSRTNPPSPTPPPTARHKSASPKLRSDRGRNYDSTSSSGTEDDFVSRKPKAVPKSRLRNQKFANLRSQTGSTPTTDSAKPASSENIFGAFSSNSNPEAKAGQAPGNGTFKSSSHDDLRKPFTADSWKGDFGFGSFTSAAAENGRPDLKPRPNSRGRTSTRTSPSRAGQPGPFSKDSSRSASISQQPPTAFPEAKFSADEWAAKLNDGRWAMPQNDEARQQANTPRQRSPKKQTESGFKMRPTPQPASVATEAEEPETVGGSAKQEATSTGAEEVEAMDLDDESPGKNTEAASQAATASNGQVPQPSPGVGSKDTGVKPKSRLFNLNDLRSTAPFTSTNSGGIEDLQDIHATLPFESRAKVPRTTVRDVRPRRLICPNPPKRPSPPGLVPISAGSQQLGLPRAAWDRYVAEMGTYIREWNAFNRRLLHHFNARQDAMETGMAPNWIGAVGDSTRIKINEPSGDDDEKVAREDDDDVEGDDAMVAGSAKAGFSAYLRAFDEDERVHKHWEVARENHRKCIVELGEMREWILNGGKLI